MTAPIAMFVYNRPWHLQKTIAALQKNELAADSDLVIFADGLRRASHAESFNRVRKILQQPISGFRRVEICSLTENYGLARNIISGVSQIIDQYGEIIVLEDDMLTSPYFLRFMNEGLDFYRNDLQVISLHGYVYPVEAELPETFFIRGADCWGWATWKRGWCLFEPDGAKLLAALKKRRLTHLFDFGGNYPYSQMLKRQIAGRNDSWAIRWYASAFLQNKLSLYPGRSLIYNIGNDGEGTHCMNNDRYHTVVSPTPVRIQRIPVEENSYARGTFEEFFNASQASFIHRLFSRLKFYNLTVL
jgi:hypothetical protein